MALIILDDFMKKTRTCPFDNKTQPPFINTRCPQVLAGEDLNCDECEYAIRSEEQVKAWKIRHGLRASVVSSYFTGHTCVVNTSYYFKKKP